MRFLLPGFGRLLLRQGSLISIRISSGACIKNIKKRTCDRWIGKHSHPKRASGTDNSKIRLDRICAKCGPIKKPLQKSIS